ncbi:LysR family substrate-binding domain-containing protein [Streptomyces lavendofoliae]|uniref:LysR family substrate-binding domain-containing protein n=1 Tax=Streptomyces lavendofoliae TaxID=67314 RepID=UPI003D9222FA
MTGSDASPSFRLAYVPGVTPTKWVRIWNERLPDVPLTLVQVPAAEAAGLLRAGEADAGFVRLPVDRTDLSAIPLYTEATVVVVPKDHLVAAADEVTAGDLADDVVLHPLDDTLGWERPPGLPAKERPASTADAVELVAAGIGLLVVPQSLARLHHRKDLTYRTVTDVPQSRVALSWPEDATTDLVEHFIGIVRGRTVNSTRGPQAPAERATGRRPESGGAARRKPSGGRQTGKQDAKQSGKQSGKPAGKSPRGGSAAPKGGKRGKPRRRP